MSKKLFFEAVLAGVTTYFVTVALEPAARKLRDKVEEELDYDIDAERDALFAQLEEMQNPEKKVTKEEALEFNKRMRKLLKKMRRKGYKVEQKYFDICDQVDKEIKNA